MAETITVDNYLYHLDELSDEQITEFLNQEPDAKRIAEERKAWPSITDRSRAEFRRDF